MVTDLPALSSEPAIYDYLRVRLDPAGRLDPPDLALPDEPVATGGVRWAAGALDGAVGHHGGGGREQDRAGRVAALFADVCKRPSKRRLRKLYDALTDTGALGLVDPLIEQLVKREVSRDALHGIGRWLATTAVDREPVKIGIAILGVTAIGDDVAVVRTLGAHEEFTLYAAVALGNGLDEAESELWALASAVDGWGRIHCVERLRDTEDPAIQSWILRQGYRNSIMYEYLAHIAATTGGLLEALRQPDVDREVFTAAGEIFEALVAGGPAEDLDDYVAGADAVEAYLAQIDTKIETLGDFHAITAIRSFLARESGWEERSQRGWTASRREVFEAKCHELLQRPEWADRIAVGLLAEDRVEFWRAEQAARARGVDTFDLHLRRIESDPLGGPWFQAWEQADHGRAEQLAALARDRLPLGDIATGPGGELGMGPGWEPHRALDWTLQALRDHPGVGPELVLVGLRSPVVRNRNMSLNVLDQWPASAWPAGAGEAARVLAESDPDDKTRVFAREVLSRAG